MVSDWKFLVCPKKFGSCLKKFSHYMAIDPTIELFFIIAQKFLVTNLSNWKFSIAFSHQTRWLKKKLVIDCGNQKSMIQIFGVVLEIFLVAFQKL
jgi:hypothetical protein